MTKAFKKGDEVTYINDWDRKGTAFYRNAVVYSCGKVQMVLTDAETGEEIGRHFKPAIGELTGTFPRMTEAEAIEQCLKVGASVVEAETKRLNHCLKVSEENCWGTGYDASIRKDLAALHEPRAGKHEELVKAIRAAVAAR